MKQEKYWLKGLHTQILVIALRVQKQLIKLRLSRKEHYDSYMMITKVLMTLFLWKQRNLQWRFKDFRYLCAEICRTVNGLNSYPVKNVFRKSDTIRSKWIQHQNKLIVPQPNYYEFGTKSLTSLGQKIWNSLPVDIKSAEPFEVFKKLIKTWDEQMCKRHICTYKNH